MYGIVFLILGNLSGNAIQLGIYVMSAAGYDNPPKGPVLGIAIAALTLAVSVHIFSRRGGIVLNNAFAVFKVSLLLAIIILGVLRKAGLDLGGGSTQTKNFEKPFSGASSDLANYVDSLLYILYSYSGFKQPFYALGEAKTPRRIFPFATNAAVLIQWLLFVLTNVAYLWAVDVTRIQATAAVDYTGPPDIASLFFESIFGTQSPTPKRVMTGLLALSILGNIIVMTCKS
jgi:amino acid transporter